MNSTRWSASVVKEFCLYLWLVRAAILMLCVSLTPAFAALANIGNTSSGSSLNQYVDIFVDKSDKMSLQEIAADARFEPTKGVVGFGLIAHPVWLRVSLQRDASAPQRWWLEMLPYAADEISFYWPDEAGAYQMQTAGDRYPFSARGFSYREYLFPVDLPAGRSVTLYFRVQNHNSSFFPLRAWQLEHWSQRATLEYLLLGASFGVMLGLALYNLLLFARLRDRLFLLYFLLICSYMLFVADLHGLASQLLWPNHGYLLPGLNQALISTYGALGSLFALWLLQGGGLTIWFDRLMYSMVGFFTLNIVAALLGFSSFAGAVLHNVPYFLFPLMFCAGIYRIVRGFRPAFYYLLGYGPVFFGLTALILMGQDRLAATSINMVLYVIAGAWEAVLFSQALASRVSLLVEEKELAQQLVIEEKARRLKDAEYHQKELEGRVTQRTLDLTQEVARHKETLEMLRASEAKLTELAYYDALTGLPNRRMLVERFEYMASLARRQRYEFALALIDVDKFKSVNDKCGHDIGDQLLIQIAQKLRRQVRETDIAGRLGGDEFVLIFCGPLDDKSLNTLLARIHEAFGTPIQCGDYELPGKISLGVAWYGRHGISFEDLHKKADIAMYQAKNSGGKGYQIYADFLPITD